MLRAKQVASELNFSLQKVYEWAEVLGAVYFGNGKKPRLRFHPEKIEFVKQNGLPNSILYTGKSRAMKSRVSQNKRSIRKWEK